MAHQIIATSVPRGLDGVSGYQTVLKSAGIPPRLFDRLKARSGYSHRFPHGDRRNPVVYVHRIEELAGSRWHVLGCIRDAGADHTGRSNFLAHMLGIDSAEARGKPGGPAAAAQARGCFRDRWDGPPEPTAAAKTLVVADRPPRPGDVPAWVTAGLDPGLAGDLAAAATRNRKIVLVTRPDDDVLSLFADALRLVEPSQRWGVTFNTCAIEDFDGTWKAIRADLSDAKDLRDGKATLVDLTTNPKGSDDPFARFARGEADLLPWQKSDPARGLEPRELGNASPSHRDLDRTRGSGQQNLSRSLGTQQSIRVKTDGAVGSKRVPRYRQEEHSPVRWDVIAWVGGSMVALAALVAVPFRDQLLALFDPAEPRSGAQLGEAAAVPVKATPADVRDTTEYRQAKKLADAIARLKAGVDGKTHADLRVEAESLDKRVTDLRTGEADQPPLRLMARSGQDDPSRRVRKVIETCDRVAGILARGSRSKLDEATEAETAFRKAVDELAEVEKEVDRLASEERKEIREKKEADERASLSQRQQQAFQGLQSLARAVSLPTASESSGADIGGPSQTSGGTARTIDLGPFSWADLVEPGFRLAVPRDTVDGGRYKAEIVKVEKEGDPEWEIRYLPAAEGVDGAKGGIKHRTLAALFCHDGRLLIRVPASSDLLLSPFVHLRRSVILVDAKNPAAAIDEKAMPQREIHLVEPTKVRPLVIDLFTEEKQELRIIPPKGIKRTVKGESGSNTSLAIPIASVRVQAELPNGEKINPNFLDEAKENGSPGVGKWTRLIASLGTNDTFKVKANILLSLPQATVAVETVFEGPVVDKETIRKYFLDEPDKTLARWKKNFDARVKYMADFTVNDKQTPRGSQKIREWFGERLGTNERGIMGMPLPGHETVQDSFTLFLKERYEEAEKGMKPGAKPDQPKDFKDFLKECQQAEDDQTWQRTYVLRVEKWREWFWPQFEQRFIEYKTQFQESLKRTYKIRITRISSLAFDDAGREYEVPLVICEEPSPAPDESGLGPEHDDRPGLDGQSSVPPQPAGDGRPVGLE